MTPDEDPRRCALHAAREPLAREPNPLRERRDRASVGRIRGAGLWLGSDAVDRREPVRVASPPGLPRITVVVPTYDRAHYLGESLDSVLAQTLPAAEVIVVNDGSTDRTEEVLARFGDRLQVLRTPQGGKSVAVNAALAVAKGEYVWILDDDDVAMPDALERLVAPLESAPE